jgi:hypothetical protein
VLENNGVDPLAVDLDGPFLFETPVAVGETYDVAVRRQPPGHECVVEDGSGVVDGPVTSVLVLCAPTDLPTYTVSVAVTGLGTPPATGLVLQNNGGNDLAVDDDGTFPFSTALFAGASYRVTVGQQPAGVTCEVVDGEDVSDVDVVIVVTCTPDIPTFALAVSVTGLGSPPAAGLVLQNNGGDDVVVDNDGTFPFATRLTLGASYAVTVSQQPEGAACTIASGVGVVGGDVVVDVVCERQFRVGGTSTGLKPGNSVVLALEDRVTVEVVADGTFTFPGFFAAGTLVSSVTIVTAPNDQRCTLETPTGAVVDADVLDVVLRCIETFSLGGTLVAPSFTQVVLTNVPGGDVVEVAPTDTSFVFARRLAGGEGFLIQAVGEGVTCDVQNGTGTIGSDVNDIIVTCTLAPMDFALSNPTILPDVLPADVDLTGVEFDVFLSRPFASFYGTPARAEVRDEQGALAATGTWALREGSAQAVRITFAADEPSIALGTPRPASSFAGNAQGGTPFDDDCPVGQAPIGFHVELGDAIDGLGVVCGSIEVDPDTLTVTVGPGSTLPPRGGTQTTQAEPRCPTDSVLVGVSGNAGALIDFIDMQCARLTVTGTAPALTVNVEPVADDPGDQVGGTGGQEFPALACEPGEVARGLTIRAGGLVDALGLRCSTVALDREERLAAGNYEVSLLSNFTLQTEPAADHVFARATQPLRVLPRGLTGLSPDTIEEGGSTVILSEGVAVYGDSIVMVRQGSGEASFHGILAPGSCAGATEAGCILQQALFTAQSNPPGVYDVCVVPGVDPNDPENTLPAACPPGSPTLTIRERGLIDVLNTGFELPALAAEGSGAAGDIDDWNADGTIAGVLRPAIEDGVVPADGQQCLFLNQGGRVVQTTSVVLQGNTRVRIRGSIYSRAGLEPLVVDAFAAGGADSVRATLPTPAPGDGASFDVAFDLDAASPLVGDALGVGFEAIGSTGTQTLLDGIVVTVTPL